MPGENLRGQRRAQGFTLIELMIVVAIIGILAAIAIPQMAHMAEKSKEASTKGNLGTLRSSIAIYYGDNESEYPSDNLSTSLIAGKKYLVLVPPTLLPQSPNSSGHVNSAAVVTGDVPAALTDAGGWVYNNQGADDVLWGTVVVNCSHNDMNGRVWTSY